jgi:hypothetical protein
MRSRLLLIAIVVALGGCGPGREQAVIEAARRTVKIELVDPDSAHFTLERSGPDVVCGFVNSKNSFGGYTGPRAFIVRMHPGSMIATAERPQILGETADLATFTSLWSTKCDAAAPYEGK